MQSSLRRKRKGCRFTSPSVAIGKDQNQNLSDNVWRSRKKCKEVREENGGEHAEERSCGGKTEASAVGIVMTAPPCGGSAGSMGRGLKRKLGCVDMATRFGRRKRLEQEYVLGREIGQGKFGSVRLCRGMAGGEECACKTLRKNGEETVQREVEIMQHLSGHPGVVTLKAVFEDAECFHLVMELCPGGRLLDQMMREGRFSEQRAASLLKELVSVIKYCHDMGVVHRDIKPENILLTATGKTKLADFGLAVRVANGQRLTGVAGSPAYIAPEVLSGYYTEKVDIWGAGVLLHALLVGVLPFQGNNREAVFEAIKTGNLNFQEEIWEPVSELAKDLTSRMLTRNVSIRMTADEVLKHPWIQFYTAFPPRTVCIRPRGPDGIPKSELKRNRETEGSLSGNHCSSYESSHCKSEDPEGYGFVVDALAAAIGRVRISEPKRSRLCAPPPPVQQECSSNLKANLCAAF